MDPAEAIPKLKAGLSLEGTAGRRLAPEEVLMVRPGRKCVLLGDTCNSSAILSAPPPPPCGPPHALGACLAQWLGLGCSHTLTATCGTCGML